MAAAKSKGSGGGGGGGGGKSHAELIADIDALEKLFFDGKL